MPCAPGDAAPDVSGAVTGPASRPVHPLRSRRGMSNRALAATQRQHFEPMAAALRNTRGDVTPTADLVRRWRYESLNAMVGLLRELENA